MLDGAPGRAGATNQLAVLLRWSSIRGVVTLRQRPADERRPSPPAATGDRPVLRDAALRTPHQCHCRRPVPGPPSPSVGGESGGLQRTASRALADGSASMPITKLAEVMPSWAPERAGERQPFDHSLRSGRSALPRLDRVSEGSGAHRRQRELAGRGTSHRSCHATPSSASSVIAEQSRRRRSRSRAPVADYTPGGHASGVAETPIQSSAGQPAPPVRLPARSPA